LQKKQLLQTIEIRNTPEYLFCWIEIFCSERTVAIQINGQLSEIQGLPQTGLSLNSFLSPILFLVFDADLVEGSIDSQGKTIVYFYCIGDGPTVQSNRESIETIIKELLDWERGSGATFEAAKIAIINLDPKISKLEKEFFNIKGQTVESREYVKILVVLMDTRLKYKEYIARAVSKILETVMELHSQQQRGRCSYQLWPRW